MEEKKMAKNAALGAKREEDVDLIVAASSSFSFKGLSGNGKYLSNLQENPYALRVQLL